MIETLYPINRYILLFPALAFDDPGFYLGPVRCRFRLLSEDDVSSWIACASSSENQLRIFLAKIPSIHPDVDKSRNKGLTRFIQLRI